jgi:hypothetical protein
MINIGSAYDKQNRDNLSQPVSTLPPFSSDMPQE